MKHNKLLQLALCFQALGIKYFPFQAFHLTKSTMSFPLYMDEF